MIRNAWWLVLLAGCAKQGANGPTAELPNPDALFATYNDLIGCNADEDLFGDSWVSTGTMEIPGMGVSGQQTTVKNGDALLIRIELPGLGTMEQGFAGDYAWSVDPMQGPRLLGDAEKRTITDQSELCSEASSKYSELAVSGTEELLERGSWKVTGKDEQGEPVVFWFDKDNGLMLGVQRTNKSPMGKVKATMYFEEYQEFAGLKMATRVLTKSSGVKMVVTIDDWDMDPKDLEPIQPPPLVQELIDEREAAAGPKEAASDEAPAEGEAAPAEGEAAPAEGEAAPAEVEAAPAEGEAAPTE